jgi:hypothetical protein
MRIQNACWHNLTDDQKIKLHIKKTLKKPLNKPLLSQLKFAIIGKDKTIKIHLITQIDT